MWSIKANKFSERAGARTSHSSPAVEASPSPGTRGGRACRVSTSSPWTTGSLGAARPFLRSKGEGKGDGKGEGDGKGKSGGNKLKWFRSNSPHHFAKDCDNVAAQEAIAAVKKKMVDKKEVKFKKTFKKRSNAAAAEESETSSDSDSDNDSDEDFKSKGIKRASNASKIDAKAQEEAKARIAAHGEMLKATGAPRSVRKEQMKALEDGMRRPMGFE